MLESTFLSLDRADARSWHTDVKGKFSVKSFYKFSVKSFYKVLSRSQGSEDCWRKFWNKLVSPRVLVFCWLVRKRKILTSDKL